MSYAQNITIAFISVSDWLRSQHPHIDWSKHAARDSFKACSKWQFYLQGVSSVVVRYAPDLLDCVIVVSLISEHLVVKLIRQSVLASRLPLVTDCQASDLWLAGHVTVIVRADNDANERRTALSKPLLQWKNNKER